jgi:hypothetical protein
MRSISSNFHRAARIARQRSTRTILPALVAVGRAYLAVSGQDPLTGTAVNSNFLEVQPVRAGPMIAEPARQSGSASRL